jgi:hypothetical protein
MIHLKQFIDKMAVVESRQNRDVVLPINEARGLRDDIVRLLADLHELSKKQPAVSDEIIKVEVKGGSFK